MVVVASLINCATGRGTKVSGCCSSSWCDIFVRFLWESVSLFDVLELYSIVLMLGRLAERMRSVLAIVSGKRCFKEA